MKRLLSITIIVLFSALLAMPTFAAQGDGAASAADPSANGNGNGNQTTIEQKHIDQQKVAKKISDKRKEARARVDKLMKERLKNIRQNNPGNTGPIGNL